MFTKIRFLTIEFLSHFIFNKASRQNFIKSKAFDFHKKLNSLKKSEKYLDFNSIGFISGGWNIGFIIDEKYVFKTRKRQDDKACFEKVLKEKEITDKFAQYISFQIPQIEIVENKDFVFIKYLYIKGRNLNTFSARTIKKHADSLGKDIAKFIFEMQSCQTTEKKFIHADLCNNIIINPKTMKVTGIIDWEYASIGELNTEFKNTVAYSKKIRNANIEQIARNYYQKLSNQ